MKIIFDNKEQQQRWFDSVLCPSYLGLKDTNKCGVSSEMNCETCWKQCGLEMEIRGENDISDKVCCKCKYDYVDTYAWPCSSCEAYSEFEPKSKEGV